MPRVTLKIGESGFGEVLLDGRPIETRAVAITTEAGEPTEVTLVLAPSDIDVEVYVEDAHLYKVPHDEIPAVLCEHANECPSVCPCPPNCYCRRNGSAPSCRKV